MLNFRCSPKGATLQAESHRTVQPFYEHCVFHLAMEYLSWSGLPAERILTDTLDPELDGYRLLAYLQRVDACYREWKLYPCLDDLEARVARLRELGECALELEAGFHSELSAVDLNSRELVRKPVEQTGWEAVLRLLEHALPHLQGAVERGDELREELHRSIRFGPVGVLPLDAREGWLLLRQRHEALVYAYSLPLVRKPGRTGQHGLVRTQYFATWTVGLGNTYGHIKAELVRTGPLPNPATFVFESDLSLPRIETFLPLAKRIAYELVSAPRA
jgi:hypothetical protein